MKIAILDDNKTQLQLVEQVLTDSNSVLDISECLVFDSGIALLDTLKQRTFDVLILDRHVPDLSGDVILQWLRQYSISLFGSYPIVIMLTHLRLEEDELYSLQSGADDYITKPFSPQRLVMRIKRLLDMHQMCRSLGGNIMNSNKSLTAVDMGNNRSNMNLPTTIKTIDTKANPIVRIAGFEFRVFDSVVVFDGLPVRLTMLEFNLALLLLANMGAPISRQDILQYAWNDHEQDKARTLATHIHRLRHKLQLDVKNGFNLRTIYGYGYRLDYNPEFTTVETNQHKWSHAIHEK